MIERVRCHSWYLALNADRRDWRFVRTPAHVRADPRHGLSVTRLALGCGPSIALVDSGADFDRATPDPRAGKPVFDEPGTSSTTFGSLGSIDPVEARPDAGVPSSPP